MNLADPCRPHQHTACLPGTVSWQILMLGRSAFDATLFRALPNIAGYDPGPQLLTVAGLHTVHICTPMLKAVHLLAAVVCSSHLRLCRDVLAATAVATHVVRSPSNGFRGRLNETLPRAVQRCWGAHVYCSSSSVPFSRRASRWPRGASWTGAQRSRPSTASGMASDCSWRLLAGCAQACLCQTLRCWCRDLAAAMSAVCWGSTGAPTQQASVEYATSAAQLSDRTGITTCPLGTSLSATGQFLLQSCNLITCCCHSTAGRPERLDCLTFRC